MQLFEDQDGVNLFTSKLHMLDHISRDVVRICDLRLLDASPLEHFDNTVKVFIRMTPMRKNASTEKAAKAMSVSVEDETRSDGIISNDRPTRLARGGYRIIFAGVEYCLHKSLAHLTPDARASIF